MMAIVLFYDREGCYYMFRAAINTLHNARLRLNGWRNKHNHYLTWEIKDLGKRLYRYRIINHSSMQYPTYLYVKDIHKYSHALNDSSPIDGLTILCG